MKLEMYENLRACIDYKELHSFRIIPEPPPKQCKTIYEKHGFCTMPQKSMKPFLEFLVQRKRQKCLRAYTISFKSMKYY